MSIFTGPHQIGIEILIVAGSRESKVPEIYGKIYGVVERSGLELEYLNIALLQ